MCLLTASVEVLNSPGLDWNLIIEAIFKIVVALVTGFVGVQGGSWIMSKNEVAGLEKDKTKAEVDAIKQQRFRELLSDGAGFAYENIIRPKKQADPKLSLTGSKAFREEAEKAFLNFVRNVAAERGLGQYITAFTDDQLIVALKAILGAGKAAAELAAKFGKK